jgi:Predicted pPIWI-associating nuclease
MGKQDSNKKDPVVTLDEIIRRFDDLHKQTVTEAQWLGQARQICLELRPAWQTITGVASNNPDAQTLVNTNTALMEAYRNEVFEVAEEIGQSHHKMRQITLGVDSLVQATGATYSFIQPNYLLIDGSALRAEISHEDYADRLSRIDPSLGKTYRSIREVLLGTRDDPERAALYLIRQTFDHLFSMLAPDDEVRKSEFWEPKEGEKANQVSRRERIFYAIKEHVCDTTRAETLSASVSHMLEVYQALNRAHKRGAIERDQALFSLREMDSLLRQWADAVIII